MGAVRPSRVVLHSMWIAILSAVPVAFLEWLVFTVGSVGQQPQAWAGIILFGPIWVPVVALCGALNGLAAAGAHRLTRRAPRWQGLSGALAGGLAGLVVPVLFWRAAPVSWLIGATLGMVCGALALKLAGRTATGNGWGAGAAVLGAATMVAGAYQVLLARPWDRVEDCASRLGVREEAVTFISGDFPPQTWCVSLTEVQQWTPSWTATVVGLLATASLVCALMAVSHWGNASGRTPRTVLVAAIVTGGIGGGLSLWLPTVQPSSDQLAQVRADLRTQSTPEPQPTKPSEIRAAQVRTDLQRLGVIARTTAGSTVLWPKKPTLREQHCVLDTGASGVQVLAAATFTRDPAEFHGHNQLVALEHANEKVADSIAQAWRTSGVLAGADQIHGEWWFGAPAIQTAHIGFTEGIGHIQLVSDCIPR